MSLVYTKEQLGEKHYKVVTTVDGVEHTFQYIGYIKDTNTDVEIPNEFYTLLGCELLLKHPMLRKSTMDNAEMISEQLLTTRHSLISLKL